MLFRSPPLFFLRDAKGVFQLQRVPFLAARPFRLFEQAVFSGGLPMAARGSFLAVKSLLHAGVLLCTILARQSAGSYLWVLHMPIWFFWISKNTSSVHFAHCPELQPKKKVHSGCFGLFRASTSMSPTARNCKGGEVHGGCFGLFRAVSSERFHSAHSPELQKVQTKKVRSDCFGLFRASAFISRTARLQKGGARWLFRAVSSECFHFAHNPELQKKKKQWLFPTDSGECFNFATHKGVLFDRF